MLPIILGLIGGGLIVSAFTEDEKYAKGGKMSKGGGLENWGNDGSTASNNEDYNNLYAMYPDNHTEAKRIWQQLSETQKKGFIRDLDVTDAASEHISDSFLEFVNAKSYDDWLENSTNWDEEYAKGGKMAKGGATKQNFKLELYDSVEDFKGKPKETIYFEKEEDARDRMDLKEDEKGKLYEMRKGKWSNFSTMVMAKGGGVDSEIEELWKGYAEAVLFTEEEELGSDYTIYDFDKKTETSTKKMLANYYKKNKKAIEESELSLDIIGNDIWYTRSGQGAGFFDHSLDDEIEKQLTDGAIAMGEFPSVEAYKGKVSVYGGKVFAKDKMADGGMMSKGGKINKTKKETMTKKATVAKKNPQTNKFKQVMAHAKATRKQGEAWTAAVSRAWKEMGK